MSAPAWLGAQCACPRCKARRASGPGCPCPECQPGPGIDHLAGAGARYRTRYERMKLLLALPEETLTAQEASELDGLLNWYIHRS